MLAQLVSLVSKLVRCVAWLIVGLRAPTASREMHFFETMMAMGEALQKCNPDY